MTDDFTTLIAALDTDDSRVQQHAGRQLADAGAAALPALLAAARSPSPQTRKAVAFLLVRAGATPEVMTALIDALLDAEPKVRKNAALSLGSLGASAVTPLTAAVTPLTAAIAAETIAWVRASMVLALGAIGGPDAHAALQAVEPRDDREREAMEKALRRTAPRGRRVQWRDGLDWTLPLFMDAPLGLERTAVDEATAQGIAGCRVLSAGLISCPDSVTPWHLIPTLRCVYGVLIDGGTGAAFPADEPTEAAAATEALLAASTALQTLDRWLDNEGEPIRYRFAVKGGVPRTLHRTLLDRARVVCRTFGMVDSPSNYDLELNLVVEERATRLTIRPSFMPDDRFGYRLRDVGASINPVVAAGLARLVRTTDRAKVFDPTCGSGTLLIERAHLDAQARLRGLDISATATRAANANIAAARLGRRVTVATGDAAAPDRWAPCDEVMANLPWGQRTRQPRADLPTLYRTVVERLAHHLRPGGRAVLYSANAQLIDAALARHKQSLKVVTRRRIFSGGVWSTAFVIGKET